MSKTIFITGGNAGIGKAAAVKFAQEGCKVSIFGRRESENSKVKQELESLGAECMTYAGDVSIREDLEKAISTTFENFGSLDYALNNAGIEQVPTPFDQQTEEEFQRIMDVNVKGVWMCMQTQIPLMLKSGGGSIVNTSSIAGLIGFNQVPIYVASKHAVIGLTKTIALEYATQGIRVNTVCPGAVVTDLYNRFTKNDPEMQKAIEHMHPMGRSGKPEEVASAVYYLCNDATWTTGQNIVMDGGFTAQ